jgi:hypothetical protein
MFIDPSTTCVPQDIAKSAKNATKDQHQQQRKDLGEKEKQPSGRADRSRPPKLNLQVALLKTNTNNNGNVERGSSAAPPPPPPAATGNAMDKDKTSASVTSGHGETKGLGVYKRGRERLDCVKHMKIIFHPEL